MTPMISIMIALAACLVAALVVRDINKRKQTENKLRESELLFRTLVKASSQSV